LKTNQLLRILRPLVVLLVFVGAIGLLAYKLQGFKYDRLIEELGSIRPSQIALAIALTALNYVFLLGYDYLAIQYIGHPLPFWKLALASFIGHVSSFNFGSLLGGSSMRYRLYSAWGFSTMEVLQLIAILGLTFWLGVLFLAGIVFVVAPIPVPDQIADALPFVDVRLLGVVLLLVVLSYLVICGVRRRPLKVWKWYLPLPPPRLTIGQIAVSSADLMVAAAVLYTVLPPLEGASYIKVLGVFLLAMVTAVITHVPGGVGVLELVVTAFLPEDDAGLAPALAALVVFRAVYYLLPLVVAAMLWISHEIYLGWTMLAKARRRRRG
jgi:uncharacterized membrane protein YbhN (UPF0104 family)